MSARHGQRGWELAFEMRQAAHPEIDIPTKLLTFEEYSTLYSLSSAEPLGSRLDEYAEHFLRATRFISIREPTSQTLDHEKKKLERVALLIGIKTFAENPYAPQPEAPYRYSSSMYRYQNYVFMKSCWLVWTAHTALGAPYGPNPRHIYLQGKPGFRRPHPRPPPQPACEPTSLRPATAEDASDLCAICRIPIELGETLMLLPCEGHAGHAFHPDCITEWFTAMGKQQCVYHCVQRPVSFVYLPEAPEHSDYDYSFTFPDGPGVHSWGCPVWYPGCQTDDDEKEDFILRVDNYG